MADNRLAEAIEIVRYGSHPDRCTCGVEHPEPETTSAAFDYLKNRPTEGTTDE